ncbi:uncharacterized protein A4U43_C05F28190 [Asparagus officinalis]|uniref:ADF-H domain-containing protein n=1 Tax=Asparagus officinalis TaxID=4686 RepID=A0A5P1EV69_ASPOF|nr:uncharacterized protein A4U43_C05F28190 [Asparagus officinalis]
MALSSTTRRGGADSMTSPGSLSDSLEFRSPAGRRLLWPPSPRRRPAEKKQANSASGMALNDECKLTFLELKAKRTYHFIIFKIDEKLKQVIVEKVGEPISSYADFTAALPADECRYAIYDFDFLREKALNIAMEHMHYEDNDSRYLYANVLAKVVNFGSEPVNLMFSVSGLQNTVNSPGSKMTILTSSYVMDEDSFKEPTKVYFVPGFDL